MHNSYLKATDLIGYRVRTTDEGQAALRDLVIDAGLWSVPYLAVDADAWTPGHDVLVAARSLAEVDEAARELDVELTLEQVRTSPSLASDAPVTPDFEENWYRHSGWREQWDVEASTTDASEPQAPVAPPAEEPLPAEVTAGGAGLVRFENLSLWRGETRDGQPLRAVDLLLDDTDWTAAYLEVELDPEGAAARCLVDRVLIGSLDREAGRFFLEADAADLRQAPRRPYPGAGESRDVPVLEGEARP